MLCRIIICLKFSLAKIHLLWWYCLGQVRRLCHIRIMSRTPSVAILSLPEGSAVTAVESRCCRQRCEESWRRLAFCNKMIGKPPPGWLTFYFSPYANQQYFIFQSVRWFIALICATVSPSRLSIFIIPSYLFVLSPPSLQQLCTRDYMPLSSQHKQLLVVLQFIGASEWVYNAAYSVSLLTSIQGWRKHHTARKLCLISLFSPFDFYHLPSVVIHWLDMSLRAHKLDHGVFIFRVRWDDGFFGLGTETTMRSQVISVLAPRIWH